MQPSEYINALKNVPSPPPFVSGLCGRILRGKTDADFERLSDDPNRLVVMLTDSAGLAKMLGKTGYEMCVIVGHHPDHIKGKLVTGHIYKMVAFAENEAIVATWDNVFKLAGEVYPDLVPLFAKYGPELKSKSYWKADSTGVGSFLSGIEAEAGYKFMDVDRQDHPTFMTHAAFLQSAKGMCELRALLYHTLHLRELYSGDGYTYDQMGRKSVKEYLMLNKRIADIKGHVMLDLDVRLP